MVGTHEKDIAEKTLEDFAEVFADIMNVLLFDGEQVVSLSEVAGTATASMYKADGRLHSQDRDVAKLWTAGGASFALLGIENQTAVDRCMPLRVIGYDGASYRKQLSAREATKRHNRRARKHGRKAGMGKVQVRRLCPVVTVVLYFGTEKPWDGPKSLCECLGAGIRTGRNSPCR